MELLNSQTQTHTLKDIWLNENQKHVKSFCLGVVARDQSAVAKPWKPLHEIDQFRVG